jgi:hypothetical protein
MSIDKKEEYKRALIFLERKSIVHVSKTEGLFLNGIILEANPKFFVIKDRIDGREYFVFYSELKKGLELFREAEG